MGKFDRVGQTTASSLDSRTPIARFARLPCLPCRVLLVSVFSYNQSLAQQSATTRSLTLMIKRHPTKLVHSSTTPSASVFLVFFDITLELVLIPWVLCLSNTHYLCRGALSTVANLRSMNKRIMRSIKRLTRRSVLSVRGEFHYGVAHVPF